MNDEEISDSIIDICKDHIYAWYDQDQVKLDGYFTLRELKSIVSLLETETRWWIN